MAKSIMYQPTLFGRLKRARTTVRAARAEVDKLYDSMSRKSKPDPKTGWEPAEDLHIQLGNALDALDMALDYMVPTKFHKDQPVEAQEVAHG